MAKKTLFFDQFSDTSSYSIYVSFSHFLCFSSPELNIYLLNVILKRFLSNGFIKHFCFGNMKYYTVTQLITPHLASLTVHLWSNLQSSQLASLGSEQWSRIARSGINALDGDPRSGFGIPGFLFSEFTRCMKEKFAVFVVLVITSVISCSVTFQSD